MHRILGLWFPDWPVQASYLEHPTEHPLAVVRHGQIWVCSADARRAGVKRGMKTRHAQALCVALQLVAYDEDRDARMFEPVVCGVDQVAAGVEVLRPGLLVVDAAAAARYHGSEDKAAQLLVDASAVAGVDSCVGLADELFTAVLAARYNRVVPPGAGLGREFLAELPITALVAETALACDSETVMNLRQLGIVTLGQLAALPYRQVVTRFGMAGKHCYDIACAMPSRAVARALPTRDMGVSVEPEEPITRVDVAAFTARQLAIALHRKLAEAGLMCQLLTVHATMSTGEEVQRTWRTREALTEQATADRVRWQLDGWLSARGASISEEGEVGIVRLALDPVECLEPAQDAAGLWGARGERELAAQRVISRVQSTLGTDAVLQPQQVGGRGPAERVELVPYGEQRPPSRTVEGTWPGKLPAPHPGRLGHFLGQVMLIDAAGSAITVTDEVALSAAPTELRVGGQSYVVRGWAGPWGVDERWWTPGGREYARLQIAGRASDGTEKAWLLWWSAGVWKVEGIYD